jgi:uncharacterized damage-inducible protein DinB
MTKRRITRRCTRAGGSIGFEINGTRARRVNLVVRAPEVSMDLLDRLLGHDAWTTRQLLAICDSLGDEQLDREFNIGHRTLRRTLDHIIRNMEIWSALMAEQEVTSDHDRTIPGMIDRLAAAEAEFESISRRIADTNAWNELWTDSLDDTPRQKSFGTSIAHVVTHSMHHRAQVLYMLRLTGVESLPEGDVFSWETAICPNNCVNRSGDSGGI